MTTNEKSIHQFYSAFAEADLESMLKFYEPNIKFRDPVFGLLIGKDVLSMWSMLVEKSKGNIQIKLSNVKADDFLGSVKWTATYFYGSNNQKVINTIYTHFHFKEGLVIKQTDDFDIWKWSRQAFGFKGTLLGWTGYMQKKIQEKALLSLKTYKLQQKGFNSVTK